MAEQQVQLTDLNFSQLQEVKRQLDEVSRTISHTRLPHSPRVLLVVLGSRALDDIVWTAQAGTAQVPVMRERY
jgi:hypothetical protein